jgi:hypothetical protein
MSKGIDCDLTPEWGGIRDLDWFKQAQQIAHEIRFFNWEIEYP